MQVFICRHDNKSSPNYKANQWYTDVQRGEFQREVLITLAKKVISWNSLTKVTSFLDIFNSYVETNLSLTDMAYFAEQAMKLDLSTAVQQGLRVSRSVGIETSKTCMELPSPIGKARIEEMLICCAPKI